jgi:hypothetical protein
VGTIFLLWNACLLVLFLTSSLAKRAGHGVLKMPCCIILCGFISPVIEDSWRSLLRVSLGCCARCFGNDFGPHRWQLKRLCFLYIELGFLLLGMVCLNLI